MNRSVLHVAITPDDHYVHHGIAMLNSLRQNNRYHRLFVHVIYSNLSFSSRLKLRIFCFKFGINFKFYRIQSSPFDSAPLVYATIPVAARQPSRLIAWSVSPLWQKNPQRLPIQGVSCTIRTAI